MLPASNQTLCKVTNHVNNYKRQRSFFKEMNGTIYLLHNLTTATHKQH